MSEPSSMLPELLMASRESLDRLADLNAKRIAHLTACLDSSNKELAQLRESLLPNSCAPSTIASAPTAQVSRRRTARKPRNSALAKISSHDGPAPVLKPAQRPLKPPSPAGVMSGSRAWTGEEQARFAAACAQYGPCAWVEITAAVGSRTQKQVRAYAQRLARRGSASVAPGPSAVADESALANAPSSGQHELESRGIKCPRSPQRAKRPLEPQPRSPIARMRAEPPSSPVTPGPPVACTRVRFHENEKSRKVGFKGLGPFSADALAVARSRVVAREEDSKQIETSQNSSSLPEVADIASSTSTASSMSSWGARDWCPASENVPSCGMDVDSNEAFPGVLCPIVLEDTPFGAMLSIDSEAGMEWSYLDQLDPMIASEPMCGGVENFALDGFLEAI